MSAVDEIKEKLDIVEFIGRHVHLQKSGRSFKGVCPFHTEKTPSFFVFPENQRWHCFGCGKGGDVFNFVMEFERLDFRATLEELARLTGVELHPLTPEQAQEQDEAERLRSLLDAATDYYHQILLSAPQAAHARAYLEKRGFISATIAEFRLGYSLNSWDAARTHLWGQGFSIEEQIKAGMLVARDDGGGYDRFRDRLMIPITDRKGRAIAFGGRVLAADAQPKYMNSPQSPLFDKSKVLFGYAQAVQAIRESETAVIVEGYMDVMIPHQAGYRNVVAPMGTALTEEHLKQLQRVARRFILALDPDAAGIQATLRGLEVARETLEREWQPLFDPRGLVGYEGRLKADIRVAGLPAGKDPDELILEAPGEWETLLSRSQPVVRFYFEQLLLQENPREPKGKARIIDAMLPLLGDIAEGVEREAYVQEIALRLGLDAHNLLDRLRVRERAQAVRRQAGVAAPSALAAEMRAADMERHVLSVLLRRPELLERVDEQLRALTLEQLNDDDFTTPYCFIWSVWLEIGEHPELEMEDLLPIDIVAQVQEWVTRPLPEAPIAQWERDVVRTILRLRERRLRSILKDLQAQVAEAQFGGDLVGLQYGESVVNLSQQLAQVQHALAQRTL